MRLLLIADTHVPKRAKDLPAQVWDEVDQADVVVHAGDWVDPALLDALSSRAAHLIGCWGNNDGAELRRRLPERADVTLDGLRFTVVHETGAATGREARMARDYPGTDVLVFGHSHIPSIFTLEPDGIRVEAVRSARARLKLEPGRKYLINPGSIGQPRDRDPRAAYMTYDSDKKVVRWHRVAYPVDRAQQRILKAGLPKLLADRLAIGT